MAGVMYVQLAPTYKKTTVKYGSRLSFIFPAERPAYVAGYLKTSFLAGHEHGIGEIKCRQHSHAQPVGTSTSTSNRVCFDKE